MRNLTKTYDQRSVLDLERLSLDRGKIIGLLGPNGAGKTTLLSILAFLLPPSSGQIWFGDEKVDFSARSLMKFRRRVVLVQQQPILFTITVNENLEIPLKIRKVPGVRRRRMVEETLDLVGMQAFGSAKAHKLSAGETQRIALAQALACEPEAILLDEPTANVDLENQVTIERIVKEINQEKGISVLLATHNMTQASRLADDTVFLFEGRLANSTHENIFGGQIQAGPGGERICILQGGARLSVATTKAGPVRVRIDPSKIKIDGGKSGPPPGSFFTGRIIQLAEERSRVRVLVEAGMPLSVLVSREDFSRLGLNIGDEVALACPAHSIEIL